MTPDPAVAALTPDEPWPGLLPFTEATQAYFHGRDEDVLALLRAIRRSPLSVLFGQSGLGKSSLLRAGLFPQLRQEHFLPIYVRLQLRDDAPPLAEQLHAAIRAECQAHGVEAPATVAGATLWEYFHRRDADFWSPRNRLLTPVLVFDQFEELFTLGQGLDAIDQRGRRFLDELADLIEQRIPAALVADAADESALPADLDMARDTFRVVFSFREDFLAEFEGLRQVMPSIMRNRVRLTRMSGEQAKAAILRSGGHLVAPEVADQIIDFVSASRGGARHGSPQVQGLEVEPALLSVVCRELNQRRRSLKQATIDAGLLQGSAQQQIIADFYETSFVGTDPRLRQFIEDQLLTEGGFRDSFAYDDALRLPGVLRAEVAVLIERRLLRLEERAGVLRLELTHDLLTEVARDSRDRRQRERDAEELRLREDLRRRRLRRVVGAGIAASTLAIGLIALFAVLLQRSNQERERLAQTQAEVLLSRANSLLDQGEAGEPQLQLARALALDPHNRSTVARALAYLSQRSFPALLAELPLPAQTAREALALDWPEPDAVVLTRAQGELRMAVPARARSAAPSASTPGIAVRLPMAPGTDAWPGKPLALQQAGPITVWLEAGQALFSAPRLGGQPPQSVRVPQPQGPLLLSLDGQRAMLRSGSKVLVYALAPDSAPAVRHTIAAIEDSRLFGPGERLLLARAGRLVTLYDLDSDQLRVLEHPLAVNAVVLSPDGRLVATACQDQQARLWDRVSGRLATPPLRHEGSVLSVAFGNDGRTLLTGSLDGTARWWSVQSGRSLIEPLLVGSEAQSARLSPDGRRAAVLSADGRLSFWRLDDPVANAQTLQLPAALTAIAHAPVAAAMALATADGRLGLWLADQPPRQAPRLRPGWQRAWAGRIDRLAFSPDGQRLAVASADNSLQLLDARSGESLGPAHPHHGAILSLRFSDDGSLLASGAADGGARVYDLAQGRLQGLPMLRRDEAVVQAELSPDRRWLLTVGSRAGAMTLWLWALDTGQPLRVAEAEHIALAGFVGPAEIVATLGKSVLRWRIVGGAAAGGAAAGAAGGEVDGALRVEPGPSALPLGHLGWSAALSPDRSLLAVGGLNGITRMVDVASWAFVGEAMKSVGVVEALAFSADGRWLLSRASDPVARLWDSRSGLVVADALVQPTPLFDAALHAGGALALTAEANGSVTIRQVGLDFPLPMPDWLPDLVRLAGGGRQGATGAMEWVPDRDARLAALGRQASPLPWWQARLQQVLARLGADRQAVQGGARQ